MALRVGDSVSFDRTFRNEEILAFGQITDHLGIQHTQPNPRGNLMAHGLLLAALPTKIWGEMSFLARDLTFEFLHPVYAGDPVHCTATVTNLEEAPRGTRLTVSFECTGPQGTPVMRGTGHGLVLRENSLP